MRNFTQAILGEFNKDLEENYTIAESAFLWKGRPVKRLSIHTKKISRNQQCVRITATTAPFRTHTASTLTAWIIQPSNICIPFPCISQHLVRNEFIAEIKCCQRTLRTFTHSRRRCCRLYWIHSPRLLSLCVVFIRRPNVYLRFIIFSAAEIVLCVRECVQATDFSLRMPVRSSHNLFLFCVHTIYLHISVVVWKIYA